MESFLESNLDSTRGQPQNHSLLGSSSSKQGFAGSLAKSHAISLLGLNGTVVQVEADISANLPGFSLVGLPDASLSEATSRVRAACANSGFGFPSRKITVNLSPASVPKSGSSFDLAIAVAVLFAMKIMPQPQKKTLFAGELGLDGALKPVWGVLPIALAAREAGFETIIVPTENVTEAGVLQGIEVLGVDSLRRLVAHFKGEEIIFPTHPAHRDSQVHANLNGLDLDQVRGQSLAVEALVIAAAGGHHLSMIGSPGSGKTMLAERLPSILPPLTTEQALEVAAVESVLGETFKSELLNTTPRFQTPHHTASVSSIVGGGKGFPRPGAVSKAHHGVLFLHEALEFQTPALEALREPLESGRVSIHRAAGTALFPAKFQLVLAANPCSCGYAGSLAKPCTCTYVARRKYLSRLSGPVFDRIDIRLRIQPVRIAEARGLEAANLSSQQAQEQVISARASAQERLSSHGISLNSQVPSPLLRSRFHPGKSATALLDKALSAGNTSMRGYDRCLRLAWTIADLAGADLPTAEHIAFAALLRGSDSPGEDE